MAKSTAKAKEKKSSKGKIIGFAIYITLLIVLTLVFLAQIGMIGNQNDLENELKLSQYKLEYQEQLNKQNQQYYSNATNQHYQPTQSENNQQVFDSQNQQQNNQIDETKIDEQIEQDETYDQSPQSSVQKENKKE